MGGVLDQRQTQSQAGLDAVRKALDERVSRIIGNEPLVIYVTGSFGRMEARYPSGSDLDVFLLYAPRNGDPNASIGRLRWYGLAAEIIAVAKDLRFEPFSGDGEYLKVHNVRQIGEQLGSRHEDAENGFTARLLLLLESKYVFNEELYSALLLETIGFYFGDRAANREQFRPTALVNDILRYWRTLCLNYEHRRNQRRSASDEPSGQADFRAASALENLKLRFSRLATCFSLIAVLAPQADGVSPERVRELCKLIPTERWAMAASAGPIDRRYEAQEVVERLLLAYEGFLELVADERELLDRLSEHNERKAVRERGTEFGDLVAKLLQLVAPPAELRRMLV